MLDAMLAPLVPVIDRVLAQISTFPPEIAISAFMDVGNYDAARAFEAVKAPIVAVNGDLFPTNFEANRRHPRSSTR
jgi:hypothetical protein